MDEPLDDNWISVSDRLPPAGDYRCRIEERCPQSGSVERTFEATRRLVVGEKGGAHWFGGMRPFTDHQHVTHWRDGA